jgi:hypothetical protein
MFRHFYAMPGRYRAPRFRSLHRDPRRGFSPIRRLIGVESALCACSFRGLRKHALTFQHSQIETMVHGFTLSVGEILDDPGQNRPKRIVGGFPG